MSYDKWSLFDQDGIMGEEVFPLPGMRTFRWLPREALSRSPAPILPLSENTAVCERNDEHEIDLSPDQIIARCYKGGHIWYEATTLLEFAKRFRYIRNKDGELERR